MYASVRAQPNEIPTLAGSANKSEAERVKANCGEVEEEGEQFPTLLIEV
jgi:hypothetical protein